MTDMGGEEFKRSKCPQPGCSGHAQICLCGIPEPIGLKFLAICSECDRVVMANTGSEAAKLFRQKVKAPGEQE